MLSQRMPTRPAMDAVLTMWPPSRRGRSRGTNVSTPCTTPQKLTPIVYSQSACVESAISPKVATPALLQTMWTAPRRRSAVSASARTLSSDVTSVGTVTTSAPATARSFATPAMAPSFRSARTIRAPRAAKALAMAAPIPPPPPVMTATRPRKSSMAAYLLPPLAPDQGCWNLRHPFRTIDFHEDIRDRSRSDDARGARVRGRRLRSLHRARRGPEPHLHDAGQHAAEGGSCPRLSGQDVLALLPDVRAVVQCRP